MDACVSYKTAMISLKKHTTAFALVVLISTATFIIFVMGGFLSHLKHESSSDILDATCGPIRGNIYRHGVKTVNGYLGIPFAKAPVGALRFKKPVAAEKWTEPKDCYSYGPGCPQSGKFGAAIPEGLFEFAEDNCLTLNVFAPRSDSMEFPAGLPVIVYFYPGGFEIGFSSAFDAYSLTGILPLKDVIVVTINYRVGPLGFLTTGDDVSRGNYGLWDQTLGLHWVQQHIASFGGDPERVTIHGSSAGGASVDLLALSPHSNKLFKRFISSSGTAFCDFAIRPKAEEARIFREFAKHHEYKGEDSESLMQWYQQQPASKFREVADFQSNASGFLSFVPNFDGDFFPKPFDELRREAPKIDAMVINGEYEGLSWGFFDKIHENSTEHFMNAIEQTFGSDLVDDPTEVQAKLLKFYTEGIDVNDHVKMNQKLAEFVGDSWFNIGAFDTARSCAKHGNNVYLGSFNYYNKEKDNDVNNKLPFKGSSHCSDLKYVLGTEFAKKFEPSEEELKAMNLIETLFINFAKFGDPNGKTTSQLGPDVGEWKKYSAELPLEYYKIGYPKSEMSGNYQNGRLKIYDEINKKYGKKYREIVYGSEN